jgi:hypothetical protein
MIDEPVQNRSASVTNAKRGFVHQTSSSAKRDTCVIASAAAARNSIAKSRSDTASRELVHSASKPSSVGDALPVDREARARERGASEGQAVQSFAGIGESLRVAREHRFIRKQMVAERHRLGDLQVRVAGHDGVSMRLGEIDERAAQCGERGDERIRFGA